MSLGTQTKPDSTASKSPTSNPLVVRSGFLVRRTDSISSPETACAEREETFPGSPVATTQSAAPRGGEDNPLNLNSPFRSSDDLCDLDSSRSIDLRVGDSLLSEGVVASPTSTTSKAESAHSFSRKANMIHLGVCCMRKKLKSDTMTAMLERFHSFGLFHILCFPEELVLSDPVEQWPRVDVMICFFSAGFPLEKAVAYAQRHPDTFFLTHPASQQVLLDRRDFYTALRRNNIPTSRSIFCSRDGYKGEPMPVVEEDIAAETVSINGVLLRKPFVEKPVSSEDHNVYVYYDKSRGGGVRKLFRKKENQSSEFDSELQHIRTDGSFIYEQFVDTAHNMDVKCYTVGPNFVHAEQRKAPSLDGVVLRGADGKEVRETVVLTVKEMMVARKVIKVFRQMVCGFDILRTNDPNEFYVCDVNGWSFVKNNAAYVEQATEIMKTIFVEEHRKRGLHRICRHGCRPVPNQTDSTKKGNLLTRDLLGIVGVLRHADRTPKQKVKLNISSELILETIFENNDAFAKEDLVFKSGHPKLEKVRQCAMKVLEEMCTDGSGSNSSSVSGSVTSNDGSHRVPFKARLTNVSANSVFQSLQLVVEVLSRHHEGLKVQIRPCQWNEDGVCTEATLICKWGGWLTEAGHKQAEMLGNHFIRRIFGAEPSGHCISQNELRIMTNNERRVIYTGLDFARCLLKNPYLDEHFGIVDEAMLGETKPAKETMSYISQRLHELMHTTDPERVTFLRQSVPGMNAIVTCPVLADHERTPRGALTVLHRLMKEVVHHIAVLTGTARHSRRSSSEEDGRHAYSTDEDDPHAKSCVFDVASLPTLHREEPWGLLRQRWETLTRSFYRQKTDSYDISKIPDIFDYVSYDVCYNQESLAPLDLYPLFTLCEVVSAFVSDGEYGLNAEEKRRTGCLLVAPLVRQIYQDLLAISTATTPRSRLYFTSESHVMGLKNGLYHNVVGANFHRLDEPQEIHFLSHFVFKLYRYHQTGQLQLEVHYSAGIDKNMFGIVAEHHVDYLNAVTPMIRIHNDMDLETMRALAEQIQGDYNEWTAMEEEARLANSRRKSTSSSPKKMDAAMSGAGKPHSQDDVGMAKHPSVRLADSVTEWYLDPTPPSDLLVARMAASRSSHNILALSFAGGSTAPKPPRESTEM